MATGILRIQAFCSPPVQPHRGRDRQCQRRRLHRHPPHRRRGQCRRRHPHHTRLRPLAGREQHHAGPLRGLQPCGLQTRLPHRPHSGRAGLSRAGDAGSARNDPRHGRDSGPPQRPPLSSRPTASSPATAAAARPPPSPVCRGCWTGSSSPRTSPSTSAAPPHRPRTSPSPSAGISPMWRPARCILPGLSRPSAPTSTARSRWPSTASTPSGIPARATPSTSPTPPATTSTMCTAGPCSTSWCG